MTKTDSTETVYQPDSLLDHARNPWVWVASGLITAATLGPIVAFNPSDPTFASVVGTLAVACILASHEVLNRYA